MVDFFEILAFLFLLPLLIICVLFLVFMFGIIGAALLISIPILAFMFL